MSACVLHAYAYMYMYIKIDGQDLIVKHERICKRFIINICATIHDIHIAYLGVKEMGVNLRREIIFKSRQMVSYSNSFKPCQNYLTRRCGITELPILYRTFLSSHILMTYLHRR